ncbi:MAG TPA: riboflavin synthase [Saprospiraceae bacterium]|jgi:riboflavin synthase|nr:riboflavin synthase [Saprospiraceae bacterium]MCC6689166.1 riboflavin synthase [Saprospiraceae bacterium]HMV24059.1 riboflavin synthase [Saprospiraceae bacterium]HMW75660.1 riboflavin synthase [Saprospiraceae bacterium]HMX83843.1 riboflavin synthase [Saprospiraceae bacterium]
MFTGIIESTGSVEEIIREQSNVHFLIASNISAQLKVDQSVSHNGVCLTVIEVGEYAHRVTAVQETLNRTSLGQWQTGGLVNLERCLQMGGRLDGHIVQGHVDTVAECVYVNDKNGSHEFGFSFDERFAHLLVPKGSVCINGVSLTVNEPTLKQFHVDIIPYTFENTAFRTLKAGDLVNIEFDIIGKYLARYQEILQNK